MGLGKGDWERLERASERENAEERRKWERHGPIPERGGERTNASL